MTEQELIDKLQKIERLFSGAATEGERDAASHALDRVRERLKGFAQVEEATEFKFSLPDQWNRKLFVALLRRYGIEPYRRQRQRYTTVMARAPKSFVESTLWPEYLELSHVLEDYISDITENVIKNHIYENTAEASVTEESFQLRG